MNVRPIIDLFREGYDIKTIAVVHRVSIKKVEQVLRKALTHIGGRPCRL